MANIKFETIYDLSSEELSSKIKESESNFSKLLNDDEAFKSIDYDIHLTNKNEYDKTKFVLKEVVPSNKYRAVLDRLTFKYSEYLGG